MCGRYGLTTVEAIGGRFGVGAVQLPLEPRYNIAPTQRLPVVVEDEARRVEEMRWGLEPRWLRERGAGRPLINARDDRLTSAPTFREALRERRCIIPASYFIEWSGSQGRFKTPYLFRSVDGQLMGLAGLWFEEGGGGRSYVIITTSANKLVRSYHNRMPVALARSEEGLWLDPSQSDPALLTGLLRPYPAVKMEACPMSRRANSPAEDSARLLVPEASGAAL